MKLLFMIGSGAVGKMTVGQELMKITDLQLFHNHIAIKPVLEIFGEYNEPIITNLREMIFNEFAKSDNYGMIFTFMWAFNYQANWDYVEHVKAIFKPYNTDFYCVELVAPQEIRLARNATEKRLTNKKSKQDLALANHLLLSDDSECRLVSFEGEVPFKNYLIIDNSNLSAEDTAKMIKEQFQL